MRNHRHGVAQLMLALPLQDDQDAWGQNPFDYDASLAADADSDCGVAFDTQALAHIGARLQEYEGELAWDGEGPMCDFRYLMAFECILCSSRGDGVYLFGNCERYVHQLKDCLHAR